MATRKSVDEVLQAAVERGVVPSVVAMAGRPRTARSTRARPARGRPAPDEPVTPGHDVPDRLDDEDGRDRRGAAAGRARASSTSTRRSRPTARSSASLQVLEGFDGDTPRLRAPADARPRCASSSRHTSGPHLLVLERGHRPLGGRSPARRTCSPATTDIFNAPLVADPGTTLRVRHQHRLARPRRRGGRAASRSTPTSPSTSSARWAWSTTTFLMSDEQRANSVPIHLRGEDGAWAATDIDWSQEPDWWAGGHGLYSTPRDYLRFQRMLLGGGTLDGAKILEPATVDAAFRNQIGELDFPRGDHDRRPGARPPTSTPARATSSASGCCSTARTQPGMRAAGSGAWAGLFNTHFWVDRSDGRDRRDLLPDAAVRGAARSSRSTPTSSRRCTPRSPRSRCSGASRARGRPVEQEA